MFGSMFKKLHLVALAIYCLPAFGQTATHSVQNGEGKDLAHRLMDRTDSLAIVHANWNTHKIARKSKLYTFHFTAKKLFAANQYISFIEVKKSKRAPAFSIANEPKIKKTTGTFGEEHQAVAAINGTFFDVANGGSVDFIKIDGIVTNQNVLTKQGKRARHQEAAIVIDNGFINLKTWDQAPNWENTLAEKDVMVSGPMLFLNGLNQELDTTSFTRARHPRTAIGLKANGNVILLTVDGRQENSAGMSLPELCKTMRWLGCTSAINLDGGGSTTLWVAGYGDNGVVNFPSDNKKWDHEGSRKVANVILLKPRKK